MKLVDQKTGEETSGFSRGGGGRGGGGRRDFDSGEIAVKVDEILQGPVVSVRDFGVFVKLPVGRKDGTLLLPFLKSILFCCWININFFFWDNNSDDSQESIGTCVVERGRYRVA